MKVTATVKVEDLSALADALQALPKATARNTLRRGLMKLAEPMAETMRGLAPDDPGTSGKDLRGSIGASTKLSGRQARQHRRAARDDKQFAEVFVGAGPLPQAHLTEFGGPNNAPVGWARAAWDQHQGNLIGGMKDFLWTEIEKATKRHARKLAKAVR